METALLTRSGDHPQFSWVLVRRTVTQFWARQSRAGWEGGLFRFEFPSSLGVREPHRGSERHLGLGRCELGPTWARGESLGAPRSPSPQHEAEPRLQPSCHYRPFVQGTATPPLFPRLLPPVLSGAASLSASAFWALSDFCTFLALAVVSQLLIHSGCICCVSTVVIKRVDYFPSDSFRWWALQAFLLKSLLEKKIFF